MRGNQNCTYWIIMSCVIVHCLSLNIDLWNMTTNLINFNHTQHCLYYKTLEPTLSYTHHSCNINEFRQWLQLKVDVISKHIWIYFFWCLRPWTSLMPYFLDSLWCTKQSHSAVHSFTGRSPLAVNASKLFHSMIFSIFRWFSSGV